MKHPPASNQPRSSNIPPPKKHLGQHFLVDPNAKSRIIQTCQLAENDIVLEIGPGRGALTDLLKSENILHLYAIEADRELFSWLQKRYQAPKVTLLLADILKYDLSELPDNLVVIGNLPYNISTPIIERLIKFRHKIKTAYFTVQLEFAQRLAAKENSRDFGSLSCYVQYHADVNLLFKISRGCFHPMPKVTSCFLKLSFRPYTHRATDEQKLFSLIQGAFQQRRKKLINTLTSRFSKDLLESQFNRLEIPLDARAENISLEKFVALSNGLI